MRGLSIALGLRLALIGMTVVLIVIAALGVASLYGARADYEEAIVRSYELEASTARLLTAGVLEQSALLTRRDARNGGIRRAGRLFDAEAARARELASTDGESTRLLGGRLAAHARLRRLEGRSSSRPSKARDRGRERATREARALTDALTARQAQRRDEARAAATAETRSAVTTITIATVLALLAALVMVRDLAGRVRRPLDDLVAATRGLAAGDLSGRVSPEGPREVRALSDAFNAMADDLRNARERIEDERRKLAVTIESLGDGLVVSDDDSQVTALNPRASELLPALAVGRRLDDRRAAMPELSGALEGETIVERDGRTLAVTGARLDTGAPGSVWTIRDISERAQLERMKSDFVAAASHELRSPLTSIKGFIELLERSEDLSEKQRDSVEIIRVSTDRLVDLVEDLLEVARIDAGRVTIDPRPVDLAELSNQATALIAPRLAEKRQRLELSLDHGLALACADPARVQEIVENLLTNAHLYTPEGGCIEVRSFETGEAVAISVSDTGRGMTAEEREHAFDRFYRGRQDGQATPGTGLGLWIVRSLVELHGGSIEVASRPGSGSTFTVLLPRAEIKPDRDGDDGRNGVTEARVGYKSSGR